MERIDKLLSATGRWSRKEVKELVRQGRVLADGRIVQKPEEKADPAAVCLTVDGAEVDCAPFVYVMLYKPAGLLSATEDKNQSTVLDLLPPELKKRGLFPVGRLDYETSGLLLLTNDGELTYKLTHPKHDVEKTYIARLYGTPDDSALQKFRRGVIVDGRQTKPAKIRILEKGDRICTVEITIHEGRNRQVRKMCEAIRHPVAQLKRVATGELRLGELPKGKFRHLTAAEVKYLKSL